MIYGLLLAPIFIFSIMVMLLGMFLNWERMEQIGSVTAFAILMLFLAVFTIALTWWMITEAEGKQAEEGRHDSYSG